MPHEPWLNNWLNNWLNYFISIKAKILFGQNISQFVHSFLHLFTLIAISLHFPLPCSPIHIWWRLDNNPAWGPPLICVQRMFCAHYLLPPSWPSYQLPWIARPGLSGATARRGTRAEVRFTHFRFLNKIPHGALQWLRDWEMECKVQGHVFWHLWCDDIIYC